MFKLRKKKPMSCTVPAKSLHVGDRFVYDNVVVAVLIKTPDREYTSVLLDTTPVWPGHPKGSRLVLLNNDQLITVARVW